MKKTLMIGLTPPLEGGSERHIYEVSSRIKNCKVLTQKGSMCKDKIEVGIIGRGFLKNISFFLNSLFYILKNKKELKNFDIIHIHENTLYCLAPILRKQNKLVITVHGINGFKFYDNKFFWYFFKKSLKRADVLIAVNKEDKKVLEKYFDKVIYIPNGVNLEDYKNAKSKVEKKITFIGRIHEQKGIAYLLEAFEKISKENPDFKLEIIGEINDYAKELQEKYKNKNILWKGYMKDRKEIAKTLKSAYCIVLPSLWEGLPLVLFEALASERPVIVSDIPAYKSVIKDETLFVKVKDSKDIANKVNYVIKSIKKADELGKKGVKLAKVYDWKEIAGKTEKIYKG